MNILSIIPSLISLGSELIEDPDKRNQYAFKIAELELELQKTLIQTSTTPKVDAFVKLLHSVKPLIRPIGAALMTAFGMYAHYKGMDIDVALHAVFDGALPAWGASRHVEKSKGVKPQDVWDDDAEG